MSAIAFDNPLLLEWNNAAAVFNDPVPTHIGLVLLSHQLGYFDILPLYVVLMLMAPLFALIDRTAPHLLLPASATLYVCALTFRLTLPTWPVSGTWFFNPLAWQFVFVLGFVFARDDHGMGALARRYIVWLRILAMPVVILGTLIVWFPLWLDPTHAPEPKLFFMIDKTYVTPIRLTQFLSVVAVFSLTFRYIRWLVLLCHKLRRIFCGGLRAQHGHRGSLRAIATTIAQWTVAIELGTWRCGRNGGAAGSVTSGNGRFREAPGATRC
jgi:hypothetical protein